MGGEVGPRQVRFEIVEEIRRGSFTRSCVGAKLSSVMRIITLIKVPVGKEAFVTGDILGILKRASRGMIDAETFVSAVDTNADINARFTVWGEFVVGTLSFVQKNRGLAPEGANELVKRLAPSTLNGDLVANATVRKMIDDINGMHNCVSPKLIGEARLDKVKAHVAGEFADSGFSNAVLVLSVRIAELVLDIEFRTLLLESGTLKLTTFVGPEHGGRVTNLSDGTVERPNHRVTRAIGSEFHVNEARVEKHKHVHVAVATERTRVLAEVVLITCPACLIGCINGFRLVARGLLVRIRFVTKPTTMIMDIAVGQWWKSRKLLGE
mmetsp:Transcript_45770/g.110175  ORF Transcript_45770/g.110175 Transcript_45770/m.110175 type:complete len:324 (+) Transcript_45770:939-1910(+)